MYINHPNLPTQQVSAVNASLYRKIIGCGTKDSGLCIGFVDDCLHCISKND